MDKKEWSKSWEARLSEYSSGIPRTGIFIKSYLKHIKTSLELGCGSARDSIMLSSKGLEVTASDYEPTLINALKDINKDKNVVFSVVDASKTGFKDNSYDLVFHNGLFIYFNDNEIVSMLKEHSRISAKYLLIIVHNGKNQRQKDIFAKKGETDPVYNISFFDVERLKKLLQLSEVKNKSVKFYKFGGKADILYGKKIKSLPNFLYPFREKIIPRLYQFQRWEKTERIACLVKFENSLH